MKLFVTRHGQTDWNREGKIQGRTDIPLNDKGIEQAYQTREKLEKETIDLIICSPLIRAKQTAEIINEGKNIPIRYDERLQERNCGENEGKLHCDFAYEGFWRIDDNCSFQNVENINDLINRVHDFLEEIKKEQKNILLVTHGGVCRAINVYFKGIPEDKSIANLGLQNCEVAEYEYDKKKKNA